MARPGQRAALGAALLASGLAFAAPALGLEIFGIRLWGREEPQVEVIDPLPYAVTFAARTEDEGLARALRAASALWSDRDTPASGRAGLLAKARGDYRRILATLYNAGYYGGEISILLAGREAAELTLLDPLPPEVPVAITVDPGPRFAFGIAEIVNAPPWDEEEPADVGFALGEPARATAVGAASLLAIERWRQLGHARARETGRDVVADHATNLLEARIFLDPDRVAYYGRPRVVGSRRVDPAFITYMADLEEGARFDPAEIEAAQARLVRLGTFSLVRIEEGEAVGPDGRLPITIRVEDRPQRSLGIGATYGTLEGLGVEGFWLHRNLFGRAERLRLEAQVARIGRTSDPEDLSYQLGVTFVRPGVIDPDTSFTASVVGRQQDLETYRERAVSARAGLAREVADDLTGELGVEVTRSRVRDAFGVRRFLTIGPDARLQYDRRDDSLDATEGYFLALTARPFYELEFGNLAARGTLEGRIYRAIDAEARFVLAGRARVGSYLGPAAEESPPDQLFFAGGGGSVRGYGFRSIGVETAIVEGEPTVVGGRSLIETSAEVRGRLSERFGLVGFVDGGFVGAGAGFNGSGDWRLGAGLGVRYYTGFGPIRVDVAAPIDPRPQDSRAALYIGIGQAF